MPSRASTDIDIASRALVMVGCKQIDSFGEVSVEAQAASAIYEDVIQSVFTAGAWRFAMRQVRLNLLADPPIGRWEQCWELPPDCIRVRAATINDTTIDFERYEGRIYTQDHTEDAVLILDYMARMPVVDWPPYFVQACIHGLASELAIAIPQNEQLSNLHAAKFERLVREGRSVDAQGRTNSVLDTSRYLTARRT